MVSFKSNTIQYHLSERIDIPVRLLATNCSIQSKYHYYVQLVMVLSCDRVVSLIFVEVLESFFLFSVTCSTLISSEMHSIWGCFHGVGGHPS